MTPAPEGNGSSGTVVLGSGKSGTPWRRMQSAMRTSFATVCADGCVVDPGPGGPPPMSFWHFTCAALAAGAPRLSPDVLKRKPRPGCGSGKLGTPLARMHLANASASRATSLGELELLAVALRAGAMFDKEVLAPATAAAVVLLEPAPHPAISTPATRVTRASGRARRERVRRSVCVPFCIGCPPGWYVRIGCTRRPVSARFHFAPAAAARAPVR